MAKSMAAMVVGALLVCGGGSLWAQRPPVRLLEDSVETIAERVTFPGSLAGSITVSGGRVLRLGPDTRFYAGGRQVNLAEMAAYARAAGAAPLTIHYRLQDAIVSRVTMLSR